MKPIDYFRQSFPGKFLCCALGLSFLVGCTDTLVESSPSGNAKPLQIGGSIEQVNETRVTDLGFADGDCMGVFVVDYKGETPGALELSGNRATNYALTYDEASGIWSGNTTIYWKDSSTPVDVYGYYPYENGITSVTAYPFTVKADQSERHEGEMSAYEKSDFLWAKKTKALASDGKITLTYKHRLAGVKVTLTKGTGFTDTEWEKLPRLVTVDNTVRSATINLSTGMATLDGDFDRHIVMSQESNDSYRAVVIPQTVTAGKSVIGVNIDGISYTLKKDADLTYNPGKLHNFTVKVDKRTDGEGYELKLTSEEITEWRNDESSHYLTLNPYVVVQVEKEGTLEACLAEKSCDLNTLKNLKIKGNLNHVDFTFIREKIPYLYALNLREVKMKSVSCYVYDWEQWDKPEEFLDDFFPNNALSGKSSLRALVLPENLNRIGANALRETQLTNVLVIPNSVRRVDDDAFAYIKEQNLELVLPDSLEYIGNHTFYESNYKCEFKMPNTVKYIGDAAFAASRGFYGNFRLPDNLEYLGTGYYQGQGAFAEMGTNMTGDIVIPTTITEVPDGAFNGIGFAKGTNITLHDGITKIDVWAFGNLKLNSPISLPASLTVIQPNAFSGCRLQGTLSLPDNLAYLGDGAFGGDESWDFTISTGLKGELMIPDKISVINKGVFAGQSFTSVIVPENVTLIQPHAFKGLEFVKTVTFGKNVDYLGSEAFAKCPNLQTMICLNPIPPTVSSNTFEGIYFDKAILEVPEGAVEVYRRTAVWNQFLNITEHKELACNIPSVECLHNGAVREGVVRSQGTWKVVSCPDWCMVTPSSGGSDNKQEITIAISSMAQGSGNRSGQIVFQLDGTDYTTYTDVTQYDYEYAEDERVVLQEASVPVADAVPIFIVGEGFTASSIADGTYLEQMRQQMEHFFNIEPYRTYREYFTVCTAIAVSPDEGIIMPGAVYGSNRFNTYYDDYGLHTDESTLMEYMRNVTGWNNWENASILMLGNVEAFLSTTFRDYWSNKRISFCGLSGDSYPYDQRGLVQHEFGGHNFADLGDEVVEHFEFLKACTCPGCQDLGSFYEAKARNGFANLSLTGSINSVPWKHLIFHEKYSDIVDVYEGGHRHLRGVYRSELKSCMGTYIPYYNTISRETIVKRIMEIAGLPYSFDEFVSKDSREGIPVE